MRPYSRLGSPESSWRCRFLSSLFHPPPRPTSPVRVQDRENPLELRLSGSGPAELGELSAGEDEEEESEPASKPLLRLGGRRSSG